MLRSAAAVIALSLSATAASAQLSLAPPQDNAGAPIVLASAEPARGNLGGGFIEFLFGGDQRTLAGPRSEPPAPRGGHYVSAPSADAPQRDQMDPRFQRQQVEYAGTEAPGTVVIDTPNHFLYLVEEGGKAMRYGIGVGRDGFTWSGTHAISAMKEWPDWTPPKEMLARQPYLPHFMPGGPNNPLGARAMYLGSTLYRIHGSNEPWTIGHNVSSGCIRLRNADVEDLYSRVRVGTKVIVL